MRDYRIEQIRRAEAYSHTEAYNKLALFEPGSWLSGPVKTILELLPHFQNRRSFRGLDLGCGVGRNCIPVIQALRGIPCVMNCVDILPLAIDKLRENAEKYRVESSINGIVCSADQYPIAEEQYDLILGVSVLEHLDSVDTLARKLDEIYRGLRQDGIACFVINTSIQEHDRSSGASRNVQFEINMSTGEMERILDAAFSGSEVLRRRVVHYQYDTYRESGIVRLDTDVLTYAVKKRS
ncbi:MAG: class I SAM-dependent methyltransferase [Oscillospiraceae bacterium]|nr:class I SAM-dependent methyltransferase [Oscillospiraceae bacterium]